MTNPAPGWFPDPTGQPQSRWWNGVQWDDATRPLEPVAAPPQIPAGWYADPTGAPNDRWWDGAQWHDATQPSANATPTVSTVAVVNDIPTYASVAADTYQAYAAESVTPSVQHGGYSPMSGYAPASTAYDASSHGWASEPMVLDPSTGWVWRIVWSPIAYALATIFIVLIIGLDSRTASGPANGVSIGYWIALIVFAYQDSRELKGRGLRPFGWGWMFLGPLVYLIGRAVVMHGQTGRGVKPLIAWLGTSALQVVIVIVAAVAIALPQINSLP